MYFLVIREKEGLGMAKRRKKKTVGYLRVSTIDQSTEKFKTAILKYCNKNELGKVDFIEEKVSGTKHWKKRELGQVIEKMVSGSVLVVPELSRLARSIPQIHEIMTELRKKEIDLHIIKENMIVNGTGEMSMTVKIQVSMFAMVAELSRDFISIRTREALQVKKEQGITLGRPAGERILSGREDEIKKYLKLGLNKTAIAKLMEVNINTLARFMKELNLKNN
jgi:DNA invertase Pin-like site-specific DNA recombinase